VFFVKMKKTQEQSTERKKKLYNLGGLIAMGALVLVGACGFASNQLIKHGFKDPVVPAPESCENDFIGISRGEEVHIKGFTLQVNSEGDLLLFHPKSLDPFVYRRGYNPTTSDPDLSAKGGIDQDGATFNIYELNLTIDQLKDLFPERNDAIPDYEDYPAFCIQEISR
jgi:hypothetical protein